jgi:hypothetical protein
MNAIILGVAMLTWLAVNLVLLVRIRRRIDAITRELQTLLHDEGYR